ncbi:hypothetical protein EUBHAL_01411 [Anaerobutyricum hallii DSM 3353]|jgi:hypothetical protein|uniref:Uncharacterized protein n=1 Tax=Anaerobutyricum hallii DSM 3353 TaxID=411469 RepID=C0EVH3_9FIRM|nr:hypothetical protein EUBHAL_01411 [Anaerobutyricum hallii DSM 3353]
MYSDKSCFEILLFFLELKKKSRKINRTKEQKFTGKVKNSLCSVWQFRGKIQIKTVEGYFTVK